jgi:hypothetical protein
MFGTPGSLDIYLAAADNNTVVAAYIKKEQLVAAMEVVGKPDSQLRRDPKIVQAASVLPSDAHWIGFWSPQGTIQFVASMIATLEPQAEVKIPEFPATAPIAFAKQLAPGRVDVHVVVPAEVVKAAPVFVKQARKANAGTP